MAARSFVSDSKLKRLFMLWVLSGVSACGGGGGGQDASSASASPAVNLGAGASPSDGLDSAFLASLPSSNYAADTELRHAFDLLNQERIRCGMGPLAQNAALDASAKAHADWMLKNNVLGHTETAGTPGFTGVDIATRVAAQGYVVGGGRVGEEYVSMSTGTPTGWGWGAVRALLNAPYHVVALTMPFREIGVSLRQPADVLQAAEGFRLVMNMGWSASVTNQQYLASGQVLTYPCQGATHVYYQLRDESPNPVPGRDLSANPLGSTVLMRVRSGDELTVDSATMVARSSGQNVALRPTVGGMKGAVDANGLYDSSAAYVVADQPLQPQTDYTVRITGSVRFFQNGVWSQQVFTQEFTFTTAPAGMLGL